MYFITTKRMLEVCFFQHTPTFIIEPIFPNFYCGVQNRPTFRQKKRSFSIEKKFPFLTVLMFSITAPIAVKVLPLPLH